MSDEMSLTPYAFEQGRVPAFFRVGQIVVVYDDPEQTIFIGYGRITAMRWSEGSFAWAYDVLMVDHGTTITHLSSHIREVRPGEARRLFTLIRHPMSRAP